MENGKEKIRRLQQEILQLEEELTNKSQSIDKTRSGQIPSIGRLMRSMSFLFLGPSLNKSIKDFLVAVQDKKEVDREIVVHLFSSIIRRYVNIGLLWLIIAMIPIGISIVQIRLMNKQNEYINKQNEYIQKQAYLEENFRNSSITPLVDNLIEEIESELKDPINVDRKLTPELVTRIANMTFYLKPQYTFHKDKSYLKSIERGFILYSLINYKIDKETFRQILDKSSFAHADLSGVKIDSVNFDSSFLAGAHFSGSIIKNSSFRGTIFTQSKLDNSIIKFSNFKGAKMEYSDLTGAIFRNCDLRYVDIRKGNISNVDFRKVSDGVRTYNIPINKGKPDLDSWLLRDRDQTDNRTFNVNLELKKIPSEEHLKQIKDSLDQIVDFNWVDKGWLKGISSEGENAPGGANEIKRLYRIDPKKFLDKNGNEFYLLKESTK